MRALVFLSLAAAALGANEKPGPPHIVTVETRDYTVEFAGDRAWTIHRIFFKGTLIGDKNGFYGTVLIPEGGKFIGTGHTEGGLERVESVVLTVDGHPVELNDKAIYRGTRAELHKKSTLGPLRLEATCIATGDGVMERHHYEAPEDAKLHLLYGFMHCWLPCTTEWLAEDGNGAMLEGTFDSKGDFELRADVKWTAVFDPQNGKTVLAWFPKLLAGQGHRTAYWDKTNYHKLYTQLYSNARLPKGTRVDAAVVIRALDAGPSNWRKIAQTAAAEFRRCHDRGELSF